MMKIFRRGGAMLAAALMAMAAPAAPALASSVKVVHAPANAAKPGRRGLFNDAFVPIFSTLYGRKGAGISMAQQKRSAAKKRRVARNRRNHR